jgi:hypothetical protein
LLVLVAGLALLAAACDHYAAAAPEGAAAATAPALTPVPTVTVTAEAELEDCPAIITEAGAAVVDTLRLADGTCVPVDVAVVYRCDPSLDPVAVLDLHGHRRRFLGGRFAVEASAPPEGARALGITALGRVYDVPEDPRWLFVETGGRYERWMALPPLGAVGGAPTVQLIGDSILDGADDALLARLPEWSLAIDAEIGRSTQGGTTVAESLGPIDTDLTVIELGVNDHDPEVAAGYADRIITAAESSDGLIWVNAHGPDPDTDAVNAAIVVALGRVPHAALADWSNGAPPEAISSDGVHLLDGSGAAFVEFLAPMLEAWHQTALGRGADRCGAQVAAGA